MKRTVLATILGLSIQSVLVAQVLQPRATIEGTVREKASGQAMGGVKVGLFSESLPRFQFGAIASQAEGTTDSEGKFSIHTKPGRYRVVPLKDGFVFAHPLKLQYPREPGIWVEVSDNQTVRSLELQMHREAVISGQIVDSKGAVFPGTSGSASVRTYKYDDSGDRQLEGLPGVSYPGAAWSFVRADDRGQFRLYGLPPGDYYVSASGGGVGTFVPGNLDEAHATPLHVEAGEEIRLGTITLPPPTVKTPVQLHFKRDGAPFVAQFSEVKIGSGALFIASNPRSDFSFSLEPGIYDVQISTRTFGPDLTYSGEVDLVVGSTEVDQDVEMKPGLKMTALYFLDGRTTGMSGCRLIESERKSLTSCTGSLAPGHYQVEIQGLSRDSYVKSVKIGNRDILTDGARIESNTEIEVQLVSQGAVVTGTVLDSKNGKAPHAVVAIVPDAPLRAAMPFYRSGSTDINGSFELRGVAPGAYHLFAWTELPGPAYRNAEFMKPYEEFGTPILIEKVEPYSQDIRLADEAK